MLDLETTLDSTCKNARILIVEDDPNYRFFLKTTLGKEGYLNIEQAANGNEGYHKTLDYRPDIVILDLMMPICNGFEYCERIRARAEFAEMPILVQTGIGDMETHHKAFGTGATDLLTKPVNAQEFLARVRAHLERYQLARNVKEYRDVLREELISADALQQASMPTDAYVHALEKKYHLRISNHYRPCGAIGGDMWNIIPLNANEALVFCSDFTSHGISSAMHAMRFQTVMKHMAETSTDPQHILEELNLRIPDILGEEKHALVFAGVIDIVRNTLTFAGAGVPRPIVLNPQQGKLEMLPIDKSPIGNTPGYKSSRHELPFHPGDSLLLYSDALLNACHADGSRMDEEKAAEVAHACLMHATDIETKHTAFHGSMCSHIAANNDVLTDDLLMVLVSRI